MSMGEWNVQKKVLVTGKNSYIARSFQKYMYNYADKKEAKWNVELLSVRDNTWKDEEFSQYDAVIHCAGIVHQGKKVQKEEYERVNRNLTVEIAKKAQKEGVQQFIFLSTMNVYGMLNGVITSSTKPDPQSIYGKTKWEAEKELLLLQNERFNVCILRPPMVYGEGCKGNYRRLAKLVKMTPVFPREENERSLLHIDNLCELLRLLVENDEAGMFFPQDMEYVKINDMVQQLAKKQGKKLYLTTLFHPLIRLFSGNVLVKKVFGSLVYEKSMSVYSKGDYQKKSFYE